ncbi:uncharacterized protein PG986_011151 [Apiospora aurea]|uniref:Uncharacterized protein n=1 Tax=Apiospora aurea TaxID=335848 RepID=A0ABR1Q4B0_9PEZI
MMAATILHHLCLIVVLLALRVVSDCTSYGVDFANGGSYNIDGSSNENFSFSTIFQGCTDETITPVLRDTNGNSYGCTSINTNPEGTAVTSTCGIPYSQMWTGQWRIILSGRQIAVQRIINLTVGKPETVVVTAYLYRHNHADATDSHQDINSRQNRDRQDRNKNGAHDHHAVSLLPLPHVQDHDGQVAPVAAGDRQRQTRRDDRPRRADPDQGARAATGLFPARGDYHNGYGDDVYRHAHERHDAARGHDDGDVDSHEYCYHYACTQHRLSPRRPWKDDYYYQAVFNHHVDDRHV